MTTDTPARRPARTIAVTPGSPQRFSRPKLRYPAGTQPSRPLSRLRRAYPDPGQSPRYNPELASELLASTCNLPASKHDLIVILIEHRRALHDLIKPQIPAQAPAAP